MAKDPLLRDAVKAIKGKIEIAAGNASPEELAYLGTAIDRIGGRATVLEVEEIGDIKIAEITAHAAAVETDTITTITATQDAAEASVAAKQAATDQYISTAQTTAQTAIAKTKSDALAVMSQTETSAVATVNDAAQTAIQQSASARDQAVATAQAASDQAIATAQAAANSVTQQLVLGRKAYFLAQL